MATDTYSEDVIRDLYQGLTDESPTGETIPGVAESWSVNDSGLEYTFRIRANACWSDGKPLTASDFISSWTRALDPDRAAPNAEILSLIEGAAEIINRKSPPASLGVSAPDDHTLVVRLARPAPYFPAILAHAASFPVYSDTVARSHDAAHWISNGPYVLDSWAHGSRIELRRNTRYWDSAHVAIARVDYELAPDEHQQLMNYRAGGLDLTDNVPAGDLPALRATGTQELLLSPLLATVYLGINLTQAPYSAHPQLRQALAMAIDRSRIVAILNGGQAVAFGFVAPGTWNYASQRWSWSQLSDADRIAQARQLYTKAGFSKTAPLRIRLLLNSNPGIRQTMVAVAAMWREVLGVETEVMEEEFRVFLDSRHEHARWDVARFAWSADYNDAGSFLDTLRAGSVNNDQAYSNARFDTQLEAAAHAGGADERRQRLESAEKLMLDDYPIIPIYHFVSKHLVKPYIHGVQANPLNHLASRNLSIAAR